MPTSNRPDHDRTPAPTNRAERRAAARGRRATAGGGVPAPRSTGPVHGRTKPARTGAGGAPRRTG